MRKTKLLYSLALAPLLLGGYDSNQIGVKQEELTATTLPTCTDGQFLVYRSGAVVCEAVGGNGAAVPDCKTPGQLLTYTNSGELSTYSCTPPGSISLSTADQTTITNLQTQINQIGTQLTQIGMGSRVAARTYRGVTKATTSGYIKSGNLTGIKAANALCANEFGQGATMCDVYSLYISIAAGKLALSADVGPGWVYQAAWTAAFNNTDPYSGQADNCGDYTYETNDRGWRGTIFSLKTATGGTERVPQFTSNTPCNPVQSIVCCQ
jgi:hypothetical protein